MSCPLGRCLNTAVPRHREGPVPQAVGPRWHCSPSVLAAPVGGPAARELSYRHNPVPRDRSWAVLHQLPHGCVSAPGVPCLLSCSTVMVAQSCISSVSLITSVLHSSRPFISLTPFGSGVTCLEEFNGGKLQKAWFGENK